MIAPSLEPLRAMNSRPAPALLTVYQRHFGSASGTHPFGDRVHSGMVDMMISATPPRAARGFRALPYALSVYYSAPYVKAQMKMAFGLHPNDHYGGKWFPCVGEPDGEHWCVLCLGAAWNDMPAWKIHASRATVCTTRATP